MTNDDVGEDGAEAIVSAFLQNKSMQQKRDYLTRGRRFAELEVGQLNEGWIVAAHSWLAHKEQADEMTMDDLASELRLRNLEPPYRALEQELARRFTQGTEWQRKKKITQVVREIHEFMRECERRSAGPDT
jgi:hypothetical protein